MLIIFAGLPATGKSTIARALARESAAVYLRIDSIEQAMRDSHTANQVLDDTGYRVAYAVAEENLCLGRIVVADSVNPIELTRLTWRGVATNACVRSLEVEVVCSDGEEHRRRVESRRFDIPGLKLPSREEVVSREYQNWDRPHLVVDTAQMSADDCLGVIQAAMAEQLVTDPK
jgi:predicted kinase